MNDETIYLTREGYDRLERELQVLLTHDTAEMAERMADVREDTDYDYEQEPAFYDALNDKSLLDDRIARLRYVLERATILEEKDLDPESAGPGDRITVRDLDEKEDITFDLLSGIEIMQGRRGVSLESPVGRALLGKKVNDKVEVEVPDGVVRYKIKKIEPIPTLS